LRLYSKVMLCCFSLVLPLVLSHTGDSQVGTGPEWRVYGGDKGSTRFSPLTQINKSNVANLKVAWTFHTGDLKPDTISTIECSPIVVDGVMYVTSPTIKAFAINAATGEKIWEFDPGPTGEKVSRGVTYWENGTDKRILYTAGSYLYALDAKTGKIIPSFGSNGRVDLHDGLGRDVSNQRVTSTTPGVIFRDLLILGTSVGEGPDPTPPGHVRAFNVRTGRIAWIFHTIPHPGEKGYDTWSPDSWRTNGSANCWGGMSVDEKRGVVYLATGSPAYDFFGSDRKGDNLFSDCVVAVKADSGKYIWHFQTVHHDIWDYDLPCPPVLLQVKHGGRKIDAVAQVTKTAFVFLLDRETGKPLFPVEERTVASSNLQGEFSSPTQPFPLKPPPLARQRFTESDVTDISPAAHEEVMMRFRAARSRGLFDPPGEQPIIQFPGFHGGCNWSGAACDPTTGTLYVNANDLPNIQTMKATGAGSPYAYFSTGYFRFTDAEGYPGIKPPWSTLNAVDMNRGVIAWKKPLGEYPSLVKRGIRNTGTESFGGCIVTAGGLVFIGGTKDSMIRAFDKDSGKPLWEAQLETGGNATPCTYEVNGKQYVVIAAGGGAGQRIPDVEDTKPGDSFVAFALP
jgi:quinoprotein glucose dehydrogenase